MVTIYTPRNVAINAAEFTGTDYTSAEAAFVDNSYLTGFPSAVLLQSSTKYYNCHGFAWHKIEGGESLNLTGDDQNSTYDNAITAYTQGSNASYVEVSNYTDCTKIGYEFHVAPYNFAHSAIPTNHPDTVISKWADGPLMKHHKENCPWKFSDYDIKFFKLIVDNINGSTEICGQETYSIPYLTSNTHIEWDASSLIDIYSNGNGLATASPATTDDYGYNEYITADLTTIYNNINEGEDVVIDLTTTSKIKSSIHLSSPPNNVQINVPVEPIYGEVEAMLWASSNPGEEIYTWEVVSGGEIISSDSSEVIVEAFCPTVRGLKIKVKATNDCGESSYTTRTISVDCSGGINPLSIRPNPTNGKTTVSIELFSTETIFEKTSEWELEIYSPNQTLKKKKTNIKNKSTTIETNGWQEGIYFVQAQYKDKILQGKLIVKK